MSHDFDRRGDGWELRMTDWLPINGPALERVLFSHASDARKVNFTANGDRFREWSDDGSGTPQVPGLAKVITVGDHYGGAKRIITPWRFFGPLSSLLSESAHLSLDTILDIGEQLATTLLAVHSLGFAYLSLCPDNVAIIKHGGVKRSIETQLLESETLRVDSPDAMSEPLPPWDPAQEAYRAPEQKKHGPYTKKADVYSLGAILHDLLKGYPPRRLGQPRQNVPQAAAVGNVLDTFFELALHENLQVRLSMEQTRIWLRWLRKIESLAPGADGRPIPFENTYNIIRPLGNGGMGVVFEAVWIPRESRRAIKFPCPNTEIFHTKELASLVASMENEYVVRVYSETLNFDRQDLLYLPMEFVEGRSLRARLKMGEGRIPVAEAIQITEQIALGMQAVHNSQIVHRDLKPDNVMLVDKRAYKRGPWLKIIDFGLAKSPAIHGIPATQWYERPGTPYYMPPPREESLPSEYPNATPAYDVYSLGITFFELLGGTLPKNTATLPSGTPLSKELEPLIAQMVSLEPTQRPSMAEVAERLLRISQEYGIIDASVRTGTESSRVLFWLALGLALLAFVVVSWVHLPLLNRKEAGNPNAGATSVSAQQPGSSPETGTAPKAKDNGAPATAPGAPTVSPDTKPKKPSAEPADAAAGKSDSKVPADLPSACITQKPSCGVTIRQGKADIKKFQQTLTRNCAEKKYKGLHDEVVLKLFKDGFSMAPWHNDSSEAIDIASCINDKTTSPGDLPSEIIIKCKPRLQCK